MADWIAYIDQSIELDLVFNILEPMDIDLNQVFTSDILLYIENNLLDSEHYHIYCGGVTLETDVDTDITATDLEQSDTWVIDVGLVVHDIEVVVHTYEDVGVDADDIEHTISVLPDTSALLAKLRATTPYGQYIVDIDNFKVEDVDTSDLNWDTELYYD